MRGCQDCTEIVRLPASTSSSTSSNSCSSPETTRRSHNSAPGALFLTLCLKRKQEVGAVCQEVCKGSVEAALMWSGIRGLVWSCLVDKWVIEIL